MLKWSMYILVFILVCGAVSSYEKIYEFDENEDIIISTSVYNITGKSCLDCSCNLTIYNPSPNESIINSSYNMFNKHNGIFVSPNINLTYNENIYPITLVCNDTNNYFGGDDREGIKVSETAFDYTSIILAMIGIAIGFLIMSFNMNKNFKWIRLITFYSSFAFFFLSLALSYVIILNSPNDSGFKIVIGSAMTIFFFIVMIIIWFYGAENIERNLNQMGKEDRQDSDDRD